MPVSFDVDMYYSGDYPVSDQSWVLISGICLRKRKHADLTADALHYISNVIIEADDKNLVRIDLQVRLIHREVLSCIHYFTAGVSVNNFVAAASSTPIEPKRAFICF